MHYVSRNINIRTQNALGADTFYSEQPRILYETWNPIWVPERNILVLAANYIYKDEINGKTKWEKVARLFQTAMDAKFKFDYPYEAKRALSFYASLKKDNHVCIRKWDGMEAGD